jgi:transcriptional regulator with XRE-family HTH domain
VSITPKQCRAARALLAWNQRELAKRARIAVSTVADFERGSRSPIPNSIEAITAALEAGGARFDGARVFLVTGSARFATLPDGQPIRWVSSGDLANWADRIDAQSGLPELIERLIRASVGSEAVTLHFPAAESTQRGGWDGTCNTPSGDEFVPDGESRWELTVKRKFSDKVDKDFDLRAAAGTDKSRAALTFVYVVMRSWPKKLEWLERQRAKGKFRDVKALDIDDLIHWLDAHPSVQKWLAERMGLRPHSGVASLEEMWQRWSLCTKPTLSEDLMVAGRDNEATHVHEWLRAAPSVLTVQAESNDEAVAFLWAALSVFPDNDREAYLTHTLYAENDTAVRELAAAMKALIVVMNGESSGFAQSVALKGHHVYSVIGADAGGAADIVLSRVKVAYISEALETNGCPRGEARSLAKRSGGSIAALRRIMADETMPLPRWARTDSQRPLHAALFAGSWDERSSADKHAIANLAGCAYEDAFRALTPLTVGVGAPLLRTGTKVRLASPQDIWFLLASRLTEADIDLFFQVARDALVEQDPRFDRRDRARLIAIVEERPHYSTDLRRGIVETLNIMVTFPERATNVDFLERRVHGFVRRLLAKADSALWWSLRENLPGLAEAAPQEFLEAVRKSLSVPDAPIKVLFGGDGEGILSRDSISDLTSALERLAWSPDFFATAVDRLAALAVLDHSANKNGNRPAASLRKIFLPWKPQTVVGLDDRLAVIDSMRSTYPDVAWQLMLSLLPKNYDTTSSTSEPIWRRVVDQEPESFSPDMQRRSADGLLSWLLFDAGNDVSRWDQLLGCLVGLGEERQRETTEQMLAAVRRLDREDARLAARDAIRDVLHRHRQFAHTDWAMPEPVLAPLQAAYEELRPDGIVERERWVFSLQPNPPQTAAGHDFATMNEENEENRRRVAKELIAENDGESIFEMARAVESPFELGEALVSAEIPQELRDEVLDSALRSSDPKLNALGRGVAHGGVQKYGVSWACNAVRDAVANGWSTEAVVLLLQGMPTTHDTWELAATAGPDVRRKYFLTTPWLWFIHGTDAEIVTAAAVLLEVSRPVEALALIGQTGPARFSVEVLVKALTEAIPMLGKDRGYNDSSMLSHYCSQILDRVAAVGSVDRNILVELEWAYYGLLRSSDRDAALLEAELSSNPAFFMQIISSIYRGGDEDDVELNAEEEAKRSAIAQQAYSLLDGWTVVPGTCDSGDIDAQNLNAWVDEVRTLAENCKRLDVVDQYIGRVLSAAKGEPNGEWPSKVVRAVIERLNSEELDNGFLIGVRNRRGVTTRAPLDGGEQERELKSRYDELAKKIRIVAPRTSAILRSIAGDYQVDAVWMDHLADRIDLV